MPENVTTTKIQEIEKAVQRKGDDYELIACVTHPQDFISVVLVKRDDNGPYVAWTFNHNDGGFAHGDYRSTYEYGMAAFCAKVARNFNVG